MALTNENENYFLTLAGKPLKEKLVPCIRLVRLKFKLTNQDSAGGKKLNYPGVNVINRKGTEIRQLFPLEMALNIHGKVFGFPQTVSDCKKVNKIATFCVSKLLIWRQKWVAGVLLARFVKCDQVG